MEKLQKIREQINSIDDEILLLLQKRLNLAQKAFLEKEKQNLPTFQPEREKEILQNVKQKSNSQYYEGLEIVFKEIIFFCRKYQSL